MNFFWFVCDQFCKLMKPEIYCQCLKSNSLIELAVAYKIWPCGNYDTKTQ